MSPSFTGARKRTLLRIIVCGVGACLLFIGFIWAISPPLEVYRTFESPDQRYRVVVFRKPSLLPLSPGGGGDAGGVVRLYDAEDNVLQEKSVKVMVSSIDQVRWEDHTVDVKLFAEWPLP